MENKVQNAVRWASITEIIAKLISPITNMILARILSPEAFGIVATVTMIISFADMFTDAGFQKYLIQHQFKNEKEKFQNTTVAFWTNLIISLLLWGVVSFFSDSIAIMVGNPGLGNVITIACISLPLTSFSSIQMALYRRDFNYKTLFFTRIVGILIPFVIIIPLALLGLSYWALIIGTICGNLSNAIILTFNSEWKPIRYYSFKILKDMLSFSLWSLVEAVSIWLTTWIGTFIVATELSSYYLGIYKTSMNTVNGIMAIITGATTPILFAALSEMQNDEEEYKKIFFKFQRLVGMLVIPLGVGIFIYRNLVTNIMLGSQWSEGSMLIGLWGLTSALSIVFANYSSEVFRSKGRPQLSFLAQMIHLVFLIPTCVISAKYGYTVLVYARSLIRLQFIVVQLILMYFVIKVSPLKMLKNVLPFLIGASLMGGLAYWLQQLNEGILWSLLSIGVCIIFYFGIVMLFTDVRNEIKQIVSSNKTLLRIINVFKIKKIEVKV